MSINCLEQTGSEFGGKVEQLAPAAHAERWAAMTDGIYSG